MDRYLQFLPLAALFAVGAVGLGRAVLLYIRGVRVVVIDRERTAAEQVFDLVVVLTGGFWVYLICDFTWSPGPAWIPEALRSELPLGLPIRLLGAAMLTGGAAIYATAVMHMGDSWRMGIDRPDACLDAPARAERGSSFQPEPNSRAADQATVPPKRDFSPEPRLITAGIYRWSRNPIYLAFDLIVFGAFAVAGRPVLLLAALAIAGLLHMQVHREERFLRQRFGDAYIAYSEQVNRYVPLRGARKLD